MGRVGEPGAPHPRAQPMPPQPTTPQPMPTQPMRKELTMPAAALAFRGEDVACPLSRRPRAQHETATAILARPWSIRHLRGQGLATRAPENAKSVTSGCDRNIRMESF
jgi:hypothetical protein